MGRLPAVDGAIEALTTIWSNPPSGPRVLVITGRVPHVPAYTNSPTGVLRVSRSTFLSRRLLALAAGIALGFSVLPAVSASAAPRVTDNLFGMHDGDPTSWPTSPVGSIRLWDSGVNWRDIETSKGVFEFDRLDAQIATARAHGARILLVLGQTPRFHSSKPSQRASYGEGAAAMPTRASWFTYVKKVVDRYQGRGVDYQVWNEANVEGYWKGSSAEMAKLTKWTSHIVNRHDRAARVVAPALATRLTSQRKWLRTFYAQSTGGRRVASYVDIVAVNLYPLPKDDPEDSMKLLAASRIMLRAAGVHKQIWNTEINYGLLGGGSANNISRRKEAAFVARTYVLNAANGVKRVFWYAWDLQHLANTELTYSNDTSLTGAGVAYDVVQEWLKGTRVQDCSSDRRGTWTCKTTYGDGVKRIYWNPSRSVTVRAVGSATRWENLKGVEHRITGGEALGVGTRPIMVRSSR